MTRLDPDDRSDGELLAAVADGDPAALRTLYERHPPWLTGWTAAAWWSRDPARR